MGRAGASRRSAPIDKPGWRRSSRRQAVCPGEAGAHLLVDLVDRAAADRVVGMVLDQIAPRLPELAPAIRPAGHAGQRARWLGVAFQRGLAGVVGLLDPHPRREDARQHGESLRRAQLAAHDRNLLDVAQRFAHGCNVVRQRAMDHLGAPAQALVGPGDQLRQLGLGHHVVRTIQEQQVGRGRVRREQVDLELDHAREGIRRSGRPGQVAIPRPDKDRQHPRAVGGFPQQRGRRGGQPALQRGGFNPTPARICGSWLMCPNGSGV